MAQDNWSAQAYAANAAFVPELGAGILEWLDPKPGELILDLGCGDGTLAGKIAAAEAEVIGVDSSESMLQAARSRGIEAVRMEVEHLTFQPDFDAVFSNAVLHWTRDIDAVLDVVHRALLPGGRFVGEFGGHGNIAAIMVALQVALAEQGAQAKSPWYFPTERQFGERLEAHGFRVERLQRFGRPTPLPTGIDGWLETFAFPLLTPLEEPARADVIAHAKELLAPVLQDETGQWNADYVRLRFAARK